MIAETIRQILASEGPVELFLEKMVGLEIPTDQSEGLELAISMLTEDLPIVLTVFMLDGDLEEGKIDQEAYEAFLAFVIAREASRDDLAQSSVSKGAAKTAARVLKSLVEFGQEALALITAGQEASEQAEQLFEELATHPQFRAYRDGLQLSVLRAAFRAEHPADLELRLRAITLLLGKNQAALTESLYHLTRIIYRATRQKMGGKWGPHPHIRNMVWLCEWARGLQDEFGYDHPHAEQIDRSLHVVESFLVRIGGVSYSVKSRILEDWERDEAQAELHYLMADLAEFYDELPVVLADREAEREVHIQATLNVGGVVPIMTPAIKMMYELEQRIKAEENRLNALLKAILSCDGIFHFYSPVDTLGQAISSAQSIEGMRKRVERIASGDEEVHEESLLELDVRFGPDELKAQVFETQAKCYDDVADGIEEEHRAYRRAYPLRVIPVKAQRRLAEYRERGREYRAYAARLRNENAISLLLEDTQPSEPSEKQLGTYNAA